MMLLAVNFENLHQILRNLYQEMMPLCADMIGVAKGVAGLGALFYVAYRVWKSLASAEPIDVFPLLRPFAIGLCIMFFPTFVLGTINAVLSPVVTGAHGIVESQIENVEALQQQRDGLEYEARLREGKEWLVNDEVYEEKFSELGIRQIGTMVSMWWEHSWYNIKMWFRQLVCDFFELLYNAAGLTIDTLLSGRPCHFGTALFRPEYLRRFPVYADQLDIAVYQCVPVATRGRHLFGGTL